MPYIESKEERQELEPLTRRPAETKDELNYQICRLVDRFMQNYEGRVGYSILSDAHAAMTDAAGEFKVRFIDPYEQVACEKNRDVFHFTMWGKGL